MLPEKNVAIGDLLDSVRGLSVAGAARTMIERMPPFEMPTGLSFGIGDRSTAEQIWGNDENKLSLEAGLYLAMEAAKGNIQLEMGKRYVIVMEPIIEPYPLPKSNGIQTVFEVIRDRSGVWLTTRYVDSDTKWEPDDLFIFAGYK
jgi:hypothetical protein